PFISEEIWHLLRERGEGEDVVIAEWPKAKAVNQELIKEFDVAIEIISGIRNIRKQNNLANKVEINLGIVKSNNHPQGMDEVIKKMGNIQELTYIEEKMANAFSFIVKNSSYYIPFGDSIDLEAEKEKVEEELGYTKGFLKSVQKKLGNERFVNNAPEEVVNVEKRKLLDAQEKIKILEEKLANLG
ncbi:MAG TPA: class I tRNA ligase family protein, partial [Brumimicrobium sp.]|nr:class I tRNA ligase family protein [Brumimicrobium sp.]